MAVICRSYASHEDARRAVEAALGAGVAGDGIRVLMGRPEHDARTEAEGEYAGSTAAGDAVGDFEAEHRRDAAAGGFAGAPDAQREGSFADADRETVTSYPGGGERVHVVGHRQIHRVLRDAGLDETTAQRDAEALHEGRILVLADVGDRDPGEVGAALPTS
jgi:hypothetical protein